MALAASAQGHGGPPPGGPPPPGGGDGTPCTWSAPPTAPSGPSFGEAGTIAIGAERLFGFHSWSAKIEPDGGGTDIDASGTNRNLLLGAPLTGSSQFATNPSGIPRAGIDFFVTDGVSLGGALGYFKTSGKVEIGSSSDDFDEVSAFAVAPRVGYAAMFSDAAGVWPRAGFTFVSAKTDFDAGGDETFTFQNLNLEVPLVLVPVDHVAITVAPLLDLGLGGSYEAKNSDGDSQKADVEYTDFGVAFGLVGFI